MISFVLVESVLSCLAALRVFFQTRSDTAIEILALRQQLAVLKRKRLRPQLDRLDRTRCLHFRTTRLEIHDQQKADAPAQTEAARRRMALSSKVPTSCIICDCA